MNVLLVGFSTTGKSSLINELSGQLPDNVEMIDSDKAISKDFDGHIYKLFLAQHDIKDPIARVSIMESIHQGENNFIRDLKLKKQPYIAAIAPNVHTRPEWHNFLYSVNPFVIFLKAEIESVYKGLKIREEKLYQTHKDNSGFGIWNLYVTRFYDEEKGQYLELPESVAKQNISELIQINEKEYKKIANATFEANEIASWHRDFQQIKKNEVLNLIKAKIMDT
ncbi:nucleoside/nucleotide kinase family protein [Chitinophaga sancti]|uniref:Shikimate kinase n=1 Tax=Chitinophaga sancti TaxID=1004 RepID=A0A1K1R766_9BACT|nr:hypothetical protein [Chitinophaga sancti]WQD64146.1 hypothetical protein U0033_07040 [Chitinophaga sancti]WQG90230.1 hypothetical protein SR876_01880 [Chitinophaga sancti]SFW67936.1 shikimate kinase [Chitinophaga sancti]